MNPRDMQGRGVCGPARLWVVPLAALALAAVAPAIAGAERDGARSTREAPLMRSELPPDHRVVTGRIVAIHDKVAEVVTGDLTPRYLDLEKVDAEGRPAKVGDRVRIIVDAQNMVVRYTIVGRLG